MNSSTKIVDQTSERVLGRILATSFTSEELARVGGGAEGNETYTGIGGKNHGPPRPDDCASQ